MKNKLYSTLTIYPAPIITPMRKLGTNEAMIIIELSTTAMQPKRSRQIYKRCENSGRNLTI